MRLSQLPAPLVANKITEEICTRKLGCWIADGRGYHLAKGSTWEYVGGSDRSVGLKYGSNGRSWKGEQEV